MYIFNQAKRNVIKNKPKKFLLRNVTNLFMFYLNLNAVICCRHINMNFNAKFTKMTNKIVNLLLN